jgi:hypothetical protein
VYNDRLTGKLLIEKDLDGSGRGLLLRYYPGIRLKGVRKARKTSVRIAGLRAKI